MPANPKYLSQNFWQRFAKISAGILGGYLIAAFIHIALAFWSDYKTVLITSIYSMYILWVTFMIIPFLFKNGWKIWALYSILITILGVLIHFGKQTHSLV
ncbi:hypothetical protein [Aquimarina aquimarini]|uniref:hypothetical protein n=1 Tax=Aquimarina aquimarini TaxID=1191734 RepID=UPI000D54FDDE|nr:hypothetical protein [Aquimarina aquimarini]